MLFIEPNITEVIKARSLEGSRMFHLEEGKMREQLKLQNVEAQKKEKEDTSREKDGFKKKVIKIEKRKVFAKQLYLSTKRCKHKSFDIA